MLRSLVAYSILALCTAAPAAKIPDVGTVSTSESNGAGAPGRDIVTWNQSQHGKYNLHVSLKDVKIIAVMNSDYYDDEDNYEYDYEDLEEILANATAANKPPTDHLDEEEEEVDNTDEEFSQPMAPNHKPTTSAHPTAPTAPSASSVPDKTTAKPEEELPAPVLTFIADGKPENISQLPNDPARQSTRPRPDIYHRNPPPKTLLGKVKCETGFVVDRLGRCRKIRRRRPSLFPFKFDFPSFRGFRIARLAQLDDAKKDKAA